MTLIGLYVLNPVYIERFSESYPSILYRQAGAALIGLLVALVISALEAPTLRLIGLGGLFCQYRITGSCSGGWLHHGRTVGSGPLAQSAGHRFISAVELAKIGLAMVSAQFLSGSAAMNQPTGRALPDWPCYMESPFF